MLIYQECSIILSEFSPRGGLWGLAPASFSTSSSSSWDLLLITVTWSSALLRPSPPFVISRLFCAGNTRNDENWNVSALWIKHTNNVISPIKTRYRTYFVAPFPTLSSQENRCVVNINGWKSLKEPCSVTSVFLGSPIMSCCALCHSAFSRCWSRWYCSCKQTHRQAQIFKLYTKVKINWLCLNLLCAVCYSSLPM